MLAFSFTIREVVIGSPRATRNRKNKFLLGHLSKKMPPHAVYCRHALRIHNDSRPLCWFKSGLSKFHETLLYMYTVHVQYIRNFTVIFIIFFFY